MPDDNGVGKLTDAVTSLTVTVARLDERTEERHGNICDRLESMETSVEGVRTAQVQHGTAIAKVQQTCSDRGDHCSSVHEGLQRRQSHLSEQLGSVREDSVVTRMDSVRAEERKRIWTRALSWSWKIGRVVLAIVAAGGAGAGLTAFVNAIAK